MNYHLADCLDSVLFSEQAALNNSEFMRNDRRHPMNYRAADLFYEELFPQDVNVSKRQFSAFLVTNTVFSAFAFALSIAIRKTGE